MEWLAAIEGLAPARALRLSFHAYPLVNAVHIAAIGCLVTCVLAMHARSAGLLRLASVDAFHHSFRRIALAAFALAVLTGVALFSVRATEYAANPAFLAKLALIGLAAANFAAWRGLPRWRVPGAIVSAAAWPAVLVAGRYIGFV